MATTLHSTSLWFTAGSSDKEYHASIERTDDGWYQVPFRYGRRSAAVQGGVKVDNATYSKARSTYIGLIKSKRKKGYAPNESGQPDMGDITIEEWEINVPASAVQTDPTPQPMGQIPTGISTPSPKKKSRPAPQLLNMIEEDEMERLISDPAFGAQQKFDGKRMTMEWYDVVEEQYSSHNKYHLPCFNKKGEETLAPNLIGKERSNPNGDFRKLLDGEDISKIILDGELVGEDFYVFDILGFTHGEVEYDLRGDTYTERYASLKKLFKGKNLEHLKLAPLASSQVQKQALLERLRKDGAEGIVFKKLDAPYTSGRPNSGGDQLKFKFYATASVIINKVNDKNSVNMMLLNEKGEEVIVGNCTIPAKVKKDLYEGLVIEVRYLYAYRGGSLYQPTYLGIRDDVDNEECLMKQLKYKGEGEPIQEEEPQGLQRKILWQ